MIKIHKTLKKQWIYQNKELIYKKKDHLIYLFYNLFNNNNKDFYNNILYNGETLLCLEHTRTPIIWKCIKMKLYLN